MAFDGEPLYTNAVDAVFFVTGRTALPIPATKDYLTGQPNPRYAEELAAMRGLRPLPRRHHLPAAPSSPPAPTSRPPSPSKSSSSDDRRHPLPPAYL